MKLEKALKYAIWAGLVGICFIPLVVSGNYYFPYIVPKTLIFKIATEILFLLFLGLAVIKKEYRPKVNLVLVLFFLYLATVLLSSFLNNTFYFSFWSNNERSEGLLLLIHLFLYLFVLSGFLRQTKEWLVIFEASFFSGILVSLVGLGQYLGIGWVLGSAGGDRITSTIGNAGYVAGYLIFNIFFGLILFFFRENKYLRWYYVLAILLQIFVASNTLTRGGILALSLSLFVFVLYLVFSRFGKYRAVRNAGLVVLAAGIIFAGLVFVSRNSSWVKGNGVLRRMTSISFSDTTAENRLLTWKSSLMGFKEKPILGYGYENFYQVFDKYFNPKIYRKAGSVVWFDRAHNIIFDRLITGGIVGLSLYLSLLIVPLIYLWARFRRKKDEQGYLLPVILTLIMAAYFIQNLFIFEALVTYIPLFLILGYLSRYTPDWPGNFFQSKKTYLAALVAVIILFLPMMFAFNVKLASANKGLIDTMVKVSQGKNQEAYDQFVGLLDKETPDNQEYRQHFAEFVTGEVEKGNTESWVNPATIRVEEEFDKQIEEKPLSARNYLMYMRFLNKTSTQNPERLVKALALAKKAAEVSPTRPQIYHEAGFSQYYLGRYYGSIGETAKAEQLYRQAIDSMQKGIDINDEVAESYFNMIMILLVTGRGDQVQSYLDKMDELGINYHTEEGLSRMGNSAVHAGNYQWTLKIYQELTEIAPDNPGYWVNLALSYAYLGRRDQAIDTANRIRDFGDDYAKQADLFIRDILSGRYEK